MEWFASGKPFGVFQQAKNTKNENLSVNTTLIKITMNKRLSNRLEKKLNGYQRANRDRFLLLSMDILSHEEFLLYEFCIAITDWDSTHYDTYGTFDATNREIASQLRWEASSTVSRYIKSLIGKGYIEIVDDRMRAKDFHKWELRKKDDANTPRGYAKPHEYNANMHDSPAKIHNSRSQNTDYSLSSSKSNVSFPPNEYISDKETDRIIEAIG